MELLDFPSDVAALVLDLLEIWELHRLAQTCRGFRDKVAKHGVLSACRRVSSMPKRSRQLLCNRTRVGLIKGLYMPTHAGPSVAEIRAQAALCIPSIIHLEDAQMISHQAQVIYIMLLLSWVERPGNIVIRYFTIHDCVYTRFSLTPDSYTSVYSPSWLSTYNFLRYVGERGYPIVRFASELASRVRLPFAPYFPEAVRPILGAIQKHQQFLAEHRGTIYLEMPPLVCYVDDVYDDE